MNTSIPRRDGSPEVLPRMSEKHEQKHTVVSDLEKAVAPHSSALAWRIPWAEEPGGLQSMGSQRVRHD